MRGGAVFTLVAAAVFAAGCSSLSITVYQYRGDLVSSYRARLAKARGEANESLARIEGNERMRTYFETAKSRLGEKFRSPQDYLKSMNRIMSEVLSPASGLPSPKNEAPNENDQLELDRFKFNEDVRRKLSVLETDLREYGALLLALNPAEFERPGDKPQQKDEVHHSVEQLRQVGRELLALVEFPDFADVIVDDDGWELVNPVHTFGGFGKSEFVIYKDETGNYQIKSAVFDPSDVAQAVQKASTGLLKSLAATYGVPLPDAGAGDPQSVSSSVAVTKANTRRLKRQLEMMQDENRLLGERLETARGAVPSGDAAQDKAARTAAAATLVKEIEDYRRRVDAIEGVRTPEPEKKP